MLSSLKLSRICLGKESDHSIWHWHCRETVIGGKIRVPVGVGVVAPLHTIMWSDEHFERPTEFIPERSADWPFFCLELSQIEHIGKRFPSTSLSSVRWWASRGMSGEQYERFNAVPRSDSSTTRRHPRGRPPICRSESVLEIASARASPRWNSRPCWRKWSDDLWSLSIRIMYEHLAKNYLHKQIWISPFWQKSAFREAWSYAKRRWPAIRIDTKTVNLQKELKTIMGNVLISPQNDELFVRITERNGDTPKIESLDADSITTETVV